MWFDPVFIVIITIKWSLDGYDHFGVRDPWRLVWFRGQFYGLVNFHVVWPRPFTVPSTGLYVYYARRPFLLFVL